MYTLWLNFDSVAEPGIEMSWVKHIKPEKIKAQKKSQITNK
jgi:hypothetical protein